MFSFATKRLVLGIFSVSSGTGVIYYVQKQKNDEENWKKYFFPPRAINAATVSHLSSAGDWNANWDCRQPNEQLENVDTIANNPTATRHIILIRHGQYHSDQVDDKDRRLTPKGCKQAKITGERLKELGFNYSCIIESTLTRAKETSAIIQEYLVNVPVKSTDLLCEGAPIRPVPSHPTWQPSDKSFHADGARIEAAFRKYIHRAKPDQKGDSIDVLVCHANVIRYFVCRALQFPPEGWLRMNLRHGSITWITIRPNGKVSVRCIGEAGHMHPELLTFS